MSTSTSLEPSSNPQAWFCTTGLPSDVVIEAGNTTFHLHKFPLVSKSRKLRRLLMEQEEGTQEAEIVEEGEEEEEKEGRRGGGYHVSLADVPGGARPSRLQPSSATAFGSTSPPPPWCPSAAPPSTSRCPTTSPTTTSASAATATLSHHVLRSLRSSVRALRSAHSVAAAAESLGLTQRLVDAIASRASSSDPSSLFGWPVVVGSDATRTTQQQRRRDSSRPVSSAAAGDPSWPEELATLGLPAYKRVLAAMESRGAIPEVLEGSLLAYARRAIPGLSRSSRRSGPSAAQMEAEQVELVEAVITHLPQRRSATPNTTTRFLFGLLRIANILRVSKATREALERRTGLQLDQATLDDLLMPSYAYEAETLYDVECVERLVAHFLEDGGGGGVVEEGGEGGGGNSQEAMVRVGRLVDGYLSEVASDANLGVERFCSLAFALPEHARLYDDGLYRAVDVYLKAHPRLSESERERVCRIMDCQKLTLEACTHAAQNERLPLRAIVQVLFFEQLQLRHTIASTLQLHGAHPDLTRAPAQPQGGEDDQVLRLDMDSIRSRVNELERECSTMKRAIERIDRTVKSGGSGSTGRASLRRRFGCKFPIQVCESHERNIVDGSRRRVGEQSA